MVRRLINHDNENSFCARAVCLNQQLTSFSAYESAHLVRRSIASRALKAMLAAGCTNARVVSNCRVTATVSDDLRREAAQAAGNTLTRLKQRLAKHSRPAISAVPVWPEKRNCGGLCLARISVNHARPGLMTPACHYERASWCSGEWNGRTWTPKPLNTVTRPPTSGVKAKSGILMRITKIYNLGGPRHGR